MSEERQKTTRAAEPISDGRYVWMVVRRALKSVIAELDRYFEIDEKSLHPN